MYYLYLTLKNLIGAGLQFSGVYIFKPVRGSSLQANKVTKVDDVSLLWHHRLDHLSLKFLSSLPGVVSVRCHKYDLDCHVCFMGKQPHNCFHLSNANATVIVIFVVLLKFLLICRSRYFLTIVDDDSIGESDLGLFNCS